MQTKHDKSSIKSSFLWQLTIVCVVIALLAGCGTAPQTKAPPSAKQPAAAGHTAKAKPSTPAEKTPADSHTAKAKPSTPAKQAPAAGHSSKTKATTLPVGDAAFALADASKIKVKEFNLGEGKLKNNGGKPVPCPLNGIIAVPEGKGPFPLAVIFQGAHEIKDVRKDKICEGFDYVVKQLAAQGYVAMSFNINVEYTMDYGESTGYEWAYEIYKQHLAKIEKANAGGDVGYGIDLKGKVDMGKLHLMGHSRGGQIAEVFARYERDEGKSRIRSIFGMAPPPMGIFKEALPDVPIGVVISEFDEDVSGSGQKVFDEAQKTSGRKSPASIVYLRGGNHAFFCRSFKQSDGAKAGLKRKQQEDFTVRYISQFLDVSSQGNAPSGLFDTSAPEPNKMYGYDVVASYFTPGRMSLLSVTGGNGKVKANGAELKYVEQEINGKIFFTHPGYPDKLPLYNIRWTDKKGAVSIVPETSAFAPYKSLSVYVATDSSDKLNAKGEPQAFTVTLKTKSGAAQSVVVPKGTAVLSYYPGKKESIKEFDDSVTEYWTGEMPLGDLRIPLSYFNAIDLKDVSEISLELNQTDSGAIMVSGMYLEP
jgi:dienelactone hydrolase